MIFKNNIRKIIAGILSLILISQIFIINYIINIYRDFNTNQNLINANEIQIDSTLINDTVKNEQDLIISSVRQSWEQYLNKNINLLLKDNNNLAIYSNDTETISFNPETMVKESSKALEGTYDIKDIFTNKILIQNAKPEWNIPNLQETLNMLIAPIKNFGNHGGFIVYDSNSGKIFLDSTPTNRLVNNNIDSMLNDNLNTTNKNPDCCKADINEYLEHKKDSYFIYMYNESEDMKDERDNYTKYPLGNYKRQFVDMAVLPYETVGFDGQPMQLTILSIVDEQDIFSKFKAVKSNIEYINKQNEKNYNEIFIFILFDISITMLSMIAALYMLVFREKK